MKKLVTGLLLGLTVLSLAGCGSSSSDEDAITVESVSSITGLGNVGVTDKFAGIVVSEKEVEVQKDSNLEVKDIKVKVGDDVKKGDVLFTYDQEDASMNLDKLKLELEEIQSTITSKQSEKAELEKEKASASSDEQLEYSIEIQSTETDIREAEYNQKEKEQEIKNAEKLLKTTKVKSPITGRIKSINSSDSSNGSDDSDYDDYSDDYGDSDSDSGSSSAFITIIKAGSYQIKGTISELNAGALTEGMPLTIYSRVDDTTWTGTLDRIDWDTASTKGNSDYYESDEMTTTTKYPFYVTLDSQDGLILGQHVYIDTKTGDDSDSDGPTIKLPSYYIVDADSSPYVWMENKSSKLTKQNVTLGDYDEDNDTYVIEDGLTLDDYIAFPSEDCTAGAKTVHSEDVEDESEETDGSDESMDGSDESMDDSGEMIDEEYDESLDESEEYDESLDETEEYDESLDESSESSDLESDEGLEEEDSDDGSTGTFESSMGTSIEQ